MAQVRRRRRRRRRIRRMQQTTVLGAFLFVVVAAVVGICLLWRGSRPLFADVMIELGQPMPAISQFTTKYADPERVELITPESEIQIDKVGVYFVKLRYKKQEETVTLSVRDTTKPTVITRNVTVSPGTAASAEDFVVDIQDYSKTTVSFVEQPEILQTYGSVPVKICVQDAHGNQTIVDCKLEYTWLKSELLMEVGHVLTKADLLLDETVDEAVLDQAALDHITWFGVGSYEVGGDWNEETRTCHVTVVDTVAPELQLQEVTIYADEESVSAEDFVLSVTEASRTAEVRLITELVFGQAGSVQTVRIEAADASGNTTVAETTLRIVEDMPPVFTGLDDMVLEDSVITDYRAGVVAMDDRDGELVFQVDSTKVQPQKPGTYYVVYTATDRSGNITEATRRVIVK